MQSKQDKGKKSKKQTKAPIHDLTPSKDVKGGGKPLIFGPPPN